MDRGGRRAKDRPRRRGRPRHGRAVEVRTAAQIAAGINSGPHGATLVAVATSRDTSGNLIIRVATDERGRVVTQAEEVRAAAPSAFSPPDPYLCE